MWRTARIHLRLSEDEFQALTPHSYYVLLDAHAEQVQHQELLFGVIASEVANRSMRPPKKWAVPRDYMPSRRSDPPPAKRVDRKQVANSVREFFGRARVEGRLITVQNG